MDIKRMRAFVHLVVTATLFLLCSSLAYLALRSPNRLAALDAAVVVTGLLFTGLLSLWRGLANLRASEDLYLLAEIRKLGGRITAEQLASCAHRKLLRIRNFLDRKVKRGQAVTYLEGDEVHYLFDGFRDQSGKDLAFKL